jgi:peptidoglycan biosynthesis protein MviN/MurJ (putative lipid II flippase)
LFFPNIAPNVAAPLQAQANSLSLLVLPGVLASILVATLIAEARQLSSLLEAIPSLVIVATLYLLSEYMWPETVLGWGTAIGFWAYLAALLVVQRRLLPGLVPRLSWRNMSPGASAVPVATLILAQVVFSLGGTVSDQIAATVLPDDQNAVISYANRLLLLVASLGAAAVARATLPVLSSMYVDDHMTARNFTCRWAVGLTITGFGLAVLGYFLTPISVRILFERGSFSAQDTADVSSAIRYGLTQLPFYFGGIVLAQAVVASRKFGRMFIANSLGVASKVIILYLGLPHGGVAIIMLSTASMYLVTFIALWIVVRGVRVGSGQH